MYKSTLTLFFFFNDTATTEIYTLSLHDALPILHAVEGADAAVGPGELGGDQTGGDVAHARAAVPLDGAAGDADRKSTRLNSSHANISYAVFCLKKKQNISFFTTCSDL